MGRLGWESGGSLLVAQNWDLSVELASAVESLHTASSRVPLSLRDHRGAFAHRDITVTILGMADAKAFAPSATQRLMPVEIPLTMRPGALYRLQRVVRRAQERPNVSSLSLSQQLLSLFAEDDKARALALQTVLATRDLGGERFFETVDDHLVTAGSFQARRPRYGSPGRRAEIHLAGSDLVQSPIARRVRTVVRDPVDRRVAIKAPAERPGVSTENGGWIVLEIEDHALGDAIHQNQWHTLAVFSGQPDADSLGASPLGDLLPSDVDEVDLDVHLIGWGVDLDPGRRVLPVRRGEVRSKTVRFDFRPTEPTCRLELVVTRGHSVCLTASIAITCDEVGSTPTVTFAWRNWSEVARTPPRSMSLIVSRDGEQIRCVYTGDDGPSETGLLGVRTSALSQLCDPLFEAVDHLMKLISDPSINPAAVPGGATSIFELPSTEIPQALVSSTDDARNKMAGSGKRLFDKLFMNGDAGAQRIGDRLRRRGVGESGLRIQVHADDDLHLPWAMLYLEPQLGLDDPGRWEAFLGTEHVIEEYTSGLLGNDTSAFPSAEKLQLSYTGYRSEPPDDVAAAAGVQREYLATAVANLRNAEFEERPGREGALSSLGGQEPGDLVYLFCHGEVRGPLDIGGVGSSNVRFGPDEEKDALTFEDLSNAATGAEFLGGPPLIILNACQIGRRSPVNDDDFASYLVRRKARGVIAATAYVPVSFGRSWAMGFFDRFLAGAEVGPTILELSQAARRVWGMSLGLLYTVNCALETRISPDFIGANE